MLLFYVTICYEIVFLSYQIHYSCETNSSDQVKHAWRKNSIVSTEQGDKNHGTIVRDKDTKAEDRFYNNFLFMKCKRFNLYNVSTITEIFLCNN